MSNLIDLNSCSLGSPVPPSPAVVHGFRRVWDRTPAGLRLVIPIALLADRGFLGLYEVVAN
ncbi:hypothetical protein [Mycobacterium leprae]|uniref:hypothetical protein n=1 Tax=Mycobacterium leprae TaxID=1769 RepID=UPI000AFA3170|nr:hypothetical protein [Mycobacterium leprae]